MTPTRLNLEPPARPRRLRAAWLRDNAQHPQGLHGTDWTLVGSYADEWVSEDSAVFAGARHYWLYESPEYQHSDYYKDPDVVPPAKVEWWDAENVKSPGGGVKTRYYWDAAEHFRHAALAAATLDSR